MAAAVRDSTFAVAHWIFAFKYHSSAQNMPALFGGDALSESSQKFSRVANIALTFLNAFVPVLGYVFIAIGKYLYTNGNSKGTGATFNTLYIVLSMIFGLLQMITATVLFTAVVRIRLILGRFGLADRVNYTMFFVNSFTLFFQVVAVCVWYYFFYKYTTVYYSTPCDLSSDPNCD